MSLLKTMRSLQTSAHSSAALPLTEPARPKHLSPRRRDMRRSSTLLSPPLSGAAISVRALWGAVATGGLSHMGDAGFPCFASSFFWLPLRRQQTAMQSVLNKPAKSIAADMDIFLH